jgi:hypothetical protein
MREKERWFSGSSTRMMCAASTFRFRASKILSEDCSPLPTNVNGRSFRCGTRELSQEARWEMSIPSERSRSLTSPGLALSLALIAVIESLAANSSRRLR